MKRIVFFGLSLLLAGCSSHKTVWEDQDYTNDMVVAKTVMGNGRVAQAEFKYRQALDRAFLVNDAQAIHDAGFNLATTQVRQNHVTDALKTVDKILGALENRNYAQNDDLHLIKAAAFYRVKDYNHSLQEARKAQSSPDRDIYEEAVAFEGYNAASLKDNALLLLSIQKLQHADKERNKANLLELETLLFLSQNQWQPALLDAQSLVISRRENGDNPAMRRALELEAQAYSGNGMKMDAERIRQQIKDSLAQDEEIQ